jgi:hypothetical protein
MNTYDFDICVTKYLKKDVLVEQPRVISFGCETELNRLHWISRIEFLRTKTVYESYVAKFVNIQFPLKKVEDIEDGTEQSKDAL